MPASIPQFLLFIGTIIGVLVYYYVSREKFHNGVATKQELLDNTLGYYNEYYGTNTLHKWHSGNNSCPTEKDAQNQTDTCTPFHTDCSSDMPEHHIVKPMEYYSDLGIKQSKVGGSAIDTNTVGSLTLI